jgi:hypothetical protein
MKSTLKQRMNDFKPRITIKDKSLTDRVTDKILEKSKAKDKTQREK